MRKRLEFVAGSSAKFWEIDVAGAQHTVTFGRLGTSGQSKVKAFADAAAAKADADKLLTSKLKKGYRAAKSSKPARATAAKPTPKAKPAKAASPDAVARLIDDAAGKAGVAKLDRLELKLPRGASLEPLRACKALRELTLRGELPDLAPLAALPRLTKIILSGAKGPPTALGDVALPKLEELILYGRIGKPTYVAGLAGLQSLTLNANTARSDLEDLAPIGRLRGLRSLNIRGAQVRSLRPLAALRLEGISLEYCNALRSLDGLDAANLAYVDASYSKVEDLSALAGARKLGSLNLRGAPVADLSPILGAVGMHRLYVEKTKVTSLAGLEKMRKLETLWAWDIRVKDLTMLEGLTSLRWLDVPTLKSPSWDFLGTLKALEHLDVMMSDVPADIAGLLLGLPKLTKVRLAKTAVPPGDADAKKLDARLRKRKGGVSFDASNRWSSSI